MASQFCALFSSQSIALDCFHCFKLRCIRALFPPCLSESILRTSGTSGQQSHVPTSAPPVSLKYKCKFKNNAKKNTKTNKPRFEKLSYVAFLFARQLWFWSELFPLWKSHFFFISTWWETWEIVGFSPVCDVVAKHGMVLPGVQSVPLSGHWQDSSLHCCSSCWCCPLSSFSLSRFSLHTRKFFLSSTLWSKKKYVVRRVAAYPSTSSSPSLSSIGGTLQRNPLGGGRIRATALSLISQIFPQSEQDCQS